MPLPTLDDLMNGTIQDAFDYELLPIGEYNGVITGAEVRAGKAGAYIKLEVTIHEDDYLGRKAWKNAVSFSEKATFMPGGIAELTQAAKPEVDRNTPANQLPAAIAAAIMSTPVRIGIDHERAQSKNQAGTYVDAFNDDGTPKMRAVINRFFEAPADFVSTIEKEAAGLDDDLPF
jgi:hypothetical protein